MNTLYMRKENEICAADRSIINPKLKSRGEKKHLFCANPIRRKYTFLTFVKYIRCI